MEKKSHKKFNITIIIFCVINRYKEQWFFVCHAHTMSYLMKNYYYRNNSETFFNSNEFQSIFYFLLLPHGFQYFWATFDTIYCIIFDHNLKYCNGIIWLIVWPSGKQPLQKLLCIFISRSFPFCLCQTHRASNIFCTEERDSFIELILLLALELFNSGPFFFSK